MKDLLKSLMTVALLGLGLWLWSLVGYVPPKPCNHKEYIIMNGDTLTIHTTITESIHFSKF